MNSTVYYRFNESQRRRLFYAVTEHWVNSIVLPETHWNTVCPTGFGTEDALAVDPQLDRVTPLYIVLKGVPLC